MTKKYLQMEVRCGLQQADKRRETESTTVVQPCKLPVVTFDKQCVNTCADRLIGNEKTLIVRKIANE